MKFAELNQVRSEAEALRSLHTNERPINILRCLGRSVQRIA
jgi:hypothetical protein